MEVKSPLSELHEVCMEAAAHLNKNAVTELLYITVTLATFGKDANGSTNINFTEQAIAQAKRICKHLGIDLEEGLEMTEAQLVVTDKHLALLRQTLDNNKSPRNYLVTHKETLDYPLLCDLVEAEFMTVCPPPQGWPGGQYIFCVTEKGKRCAFLEKQE